MAEPAFGAAIDVHARGRASRAGTLSKNSRKITTKLRQEATSSASARAIQAGLMWAIWRLTGSSPGTASSNETISAPSRTAVAMRLPILGLAGMLGFSEEELLGAPVESKVVALMMEIEDALYRALFIHGLQGIIA